MRFSDDPPARRASTGRRFLAISLLLHAALGAVLYYFGGYQVALQREAAQVASSLQATRQARTARRVEDLEKIKELMERSARRADAPEAEPAPPAKPAPEPSDNPRELLEQARTLSKAIQELDRDIKAEELAELTERTKEEARAELEADAKAQPPDQPLAPGADPAVEIARLEQQARQVLAERAETLLRKQNGTLVDHSAAPTGDGQASQSGAQGQGMGAGQSKGQGMGAGQSKGQGQGQGQGSGQSALGDIAAFVGANGTGHGTGRLDSALYRPGEDAFFGAGGGNVPPVRAGHMIKGRGRIIGPGGQFANRLYLDSWYLIGPFQGGHGAGIFNTPKYPPEDAVLLDAVYRGKGGRLVKWEYASGASYPLMPGQAEDAVYYGYTEVMLDQAREFTAWIGADDDARVWVNDRLVWKGGNWNKSGFFNAVYDRSNSFDRDYNRTEGKVALRLNKGRNKILFKLSNGPTRIFFSMVLTAPGQE